MIDKLDNPASAALLTEPPVAGNEVDTLLGSLERMRRTLAWKCADLDAAASGRRGTTLTTIEPVWRDG